MLGERMLLALLVLILLNSGCMSQLTVVDPSPSCATEFNAQPLYWLLPESRLSGTGASPPVGVLFHAALPDTDELFNATCHCDAADPSLPQFCSNKSAAVFTSKDDFSAVLQPSGNLSGLFEFNLYVSGSAHVGDLFQVTVLLDGQPSSASFVWERCFVPPSAGSWTVAKCDSAFIKPPVAEWKFPRSLSRVRLLVALTELGGDFAADHFVSVRLGVDVSSTDATKPEGSWLRLPYVSKCNPATTCSSHGHCSGSNCSCDAPFVGGCCDYLSCSQDADCGHGKCDSGGWCSCATGWARPSCKDCALGFVKTPSGECVDRCPRDCSGRGECVGERTCKCENNFDPASFCALCLPGYRLSADGQSCCPAPGGHLCSNRGGCTNGSCSCDTGFEGKGCEKCAHTTSCPTASNGLVCGGPTRGVCNTTACPAQCACLSNYEGDDCSSERAFTRLVPFCDSYCDAPSTMYGVSDSRNFPSVPSMIPRDTPDGVHPWPSSCVEPCRPPTFFPNGSIDDPGNVSFSTKFRGAWWDGYSHAVSLPTNMWWTDFFSVSPTIINPRLWGWPVYSLPYGQYIVGTTDGTDGGFKLTWPSFKSWAGIPGVSCSLPQEGQGGPCLAPTSSADIIAFDVSIDAEEELGFSRHFQDFDVDGLSVTVSFPAVNGNGSIVSPIVRGAPFATYKFTGLTPQLGFSSMEAVNGDGVSGGPITVEGVQLANGLFRYVVSGVASDPTHRDWVVYVDGLAKMDAHMSGVGSHGILVAPGVCGECTVRLAILKDTFGPGPNFGPAVEFYKNLFVVSLDVLDKFSHAVPSGGKSVDRKVDASGVKLAFEWSVDCLGNSSGCESSLLMLALPHHVDSFSSSGSTPGDVSHGISLPTARGAAVGVIGSSWLMKLPASDEVVSVLDANDPFLGPGTPVSGSSATVVESQLEKDVIFWCSNDFYPESALWKFVYGDVYAVGKFLHTLARLTLIAEELGRWDLADRAREMMRIRASQWLDPDACNATYPYKANFVDGYAAQGIFGARNNEFVYDSTWGGIVTRRGLENPGPTWRTTVQGDFGSGGYNDHLFHYGYWLYSAAVIVRNTSSVNQAWWSRVGDRVLALARDVSNPDPLGDPWHTKFRYKPSAYDGHSWARGLYPSGDTSQNFESSSEAVHCWYAMFLLGKAISAQQPIVGDALAAVGRLNLITDFQAFSHYIHVQADNSSDTNVLPWFMRQYGVVGNLWGTKSVYQSFFSMGIDAYDKAGSTCWTYNCSCHCLDRPQIHYLNELFVLLIQMVPFTPITIAHAPVKWLSATLKTNAINLTTSGYSPVENMRGLPVDAQYTLCAFESGALAARCDSWIPFALEAAALVNSSGVLAALSDCYGATDGETLSHAAWYIERYGRH